MEKLITFIGKLAKLSASFFAKIAVGLGLVGTLTIMNSQCDTPQPTEDTPQDGEPELVVTKATPKSTPKPEVVTTEWRDGVHNSMNMGPNQGRK